MSFDPSKWIFVGDTKLDLVKEQVDVLKQMYPNLKGAVICKDEQSNPICQKLPHLPAFCNTEKNVCFEGLRTTKESFDQMQRECDSK